ncbi:MAG: SusC/RagA family TonB-linked outer membrane protein [Ferruginibacter sp.]
MKNELLLKRIFGTVLFLMISVIGLAQERHLAGMVRDEKNQPLIGATVTVKNSTISTVTKDDGKFDIKVPVGKLTLIVSYVGYEKATVTIGETQASVLVKMNELSQKKMDEVVVVGAQRQTRRTSTMAITSVLSKDIENLPSPSIDNLLQGRVAGLNVQVGSGEPGVAPTVVVRGNSRVNTSIGNDPNIAQASALSSPLYVIDGIPTNPEDIANSIDATGTNYLAGMNINDIESVDVQKDAAATAAWGSRGANGVIYIKTKRGRSSKPEFRVNVYGGITQQPQLLNTVTGMAERKLKMDIINQYASSSQLANLPQLLTDYNNPNFNNAEDWQGLFYKSGSVKNVDATISSASEAVNYRVSMNYFDEKGIIENFGFKRYSLRGNFDFKINSKLNSQFIVALSKSDRQRGKKYSNSDDNTPVSGSGQPSSFFRVTAFDSANYSGLSNRLRNKNINDYYTASLTLNYDILPGLKYTARGSANITSSNRDYFLPSDLDQVAATNGSGQSSYAESDKGTYSSYFLENTLNYGKKIITKKNHAHNIALTASQQFDRAITNTNFVAGYNIPSNNIQVVSGVPQADLYGSSNYGADAMLSVLGQAQYDFDGKYLLYGSYRGDASSRFGSNSKWGYFPAVGAGWIVSDEKFMSNLKSRGIINQLKIRGSYGSSGNRSGDFYAPYNSYNVSGTYNGSTAIQPSYTNGLTKNNLTWTKTTQKNVGVEAQFLNGRIGIAADAYDKISKDDYYNFNLPFYTGYQSIQFNAHDLWVSNRGLDLTLTTKNLSRSSKLQWNMQVTLSYNKNAIAKLPNNNRTFVVDDYYGTSRIYAVGQPIYEMFQMKYMGVYNNQSEIPFNPLTGNVITYFKGNHKVAPGDPIWLDINKIGDVWTDEDNGNQYGDRMPTGDPNPKYTGGWVNDFTYKNFSLSVMSIFTLKRDVINTSFQSQISNIVGGYSSSIYSFASNRLPDLSGLNYWTPQRAKSDPGYKADFPSINPFGSSYYQFIPISSMFNEDGSYFKVKNLVLGYQVPASFTKRAKISRAKLYCIVDNVATFKNSTMPNPELVDQLGQYTGGLYATPTRYTFGIDIQF